MSEDDASDTFTKCKKGHIYESNLEECPYCSGKRIEEAIIKLVDKNPGLAEKLRGLATCYLIGSKDF